MAPKVEIPFDQDADTIVFNSILDSVKSERAFLHDIASPLTIALGMTESAMMQMDHDNQEKAREKIEKTMKALTRIAESLNGRRKVLFRETERLLEVEGDNA